MKIMKLIDAKSKNLSGEKIPTIAFLGDSVTQGCFDIYRKDDDSVETYFDKNNAYHAHISKIFSVLYPNVPINMINAGISGDSALGGLKRLERDVLSFNPDLTVVCFGLNDSGGGIENVDKYTNALKEIFTRLKNSGSEVIYMTANMMNTYVSCHISDSVLREVAKNVMQTQNQGILKAYFEGGTKVARECGVKICDVYAIWETMAENGVDITELLANKVNHPTEKLNWIFAYELVKTMMNEE